MYHFFVEQNQISDTHIMITGSDVNHIKNVLRMKEGEEIMISNPNGWDYYCTISQICDDNVKAKISFIEEAGHELPSKIFLFQGLPKGDKMELIIQKAVELGVFGIIPVAMKRSVVKLDKKKEESKRKRWNAISESAAKQSKRSVIPNVHQVLSFKEALQYAKQLDMVLIPYEMAKGMEQTKKLLGQMKEKKTIGIFIGPEGGFDEEEISLAKEQEFAPITLGKRILRTETAAITALSIIMFQLEE